MNGWMRGVYEYIFLYIAKEFKEGEVWDFMEPGYVIRFEIKDINIYYINGV